MTPEEAAAFEQYPLFPLIIQMRKWDEQAKIEQKPLPDLDRYRQMILRHLYPNEPEVRRPEARH
jgi:predicted HD phosphohydrolase